MVDGPGEFDPQRTRHEAGVYFSRCAIAERDERDWRDGVSLAGLSRLSGLSGLSPKETR